MSTECYCVLISKQMRTARDKINVCVNEDDATTLVISPVLLS